MRDRDALVIGALALIAMSGEVVPWGAGWWFPVPDVRMPDGRTYKAQVTQEFKPGPHYGVDIMYRRAGVYFAPKGTPITSARPGKVWSVSQSARGWAVVVDHGAPFATFYQHLEWVGVAKGQPVIAGQMLGRMGASSLDAHRVRHLHFAVWYKGSGDKASVDPGHVIESWRRPTAWTAPKGA